MLGLRSKFPNGLMLVTGLALSLLPVLAALDFGGVQYWTQYALAYGVGVLAVLAVLAACLGSTQVRLREFSILIPAILLVLYGWFQSVPLSATTVGTLSPATASAHETWAGVFFEGSTRSSPSSFPISLIPEKTRHQTALLVLAIVTFTVAIVAFRSRSSIKLMWGTISLAGGMFAGYGILRLIFPTLTPWDDPYDHHYFGTFVNRNNAALFLNLAIAAGLGLVAWRLSILDGSELDDEDFDFSEMISLLSDGASISGAIGIILSLAGLLTCGSRGGLLSMFFAVAFAFGWLRRRRSRGAFLIVGSVLLLTTVLVLAPLNIQWTTVNRLEELASDNDPFVGEIDGRWSHWLDASVAAWNHFPAGSGLGTYEDAHRPFLNLSKGGAWYRNADNLFVELAVEIGVIGILAIMAMIIMFIIALIRLNHSPDPIDHGVRVTGWYAITSTVVSQCFDFGLLMPANFIAFGCLAAVVCYRAAHSVSALSLSKSNDSSERSKRIVFRDNKNRRGKLPISAIANLTAVSVVMLLLAVPAWMVLYQDAKTESVSSTIKASTKTSQMSVDFLEQAIQLAAKTKAEIATTPETKLENEQRETGIQHPELLRTLMPVWLDAGRVAEVQRRNPKNATEAFRIFKETDPKERNISQFPRQFESFQQPEGVVPFGERLNASDFYERIVDACHQILQRRPLSFEARRWLLFLTFYHKNNAWTEKSIGDLHAMYLKASPSQLRLAKYAVATNQLDQAENILRQSLTVSPQRAGSVTSILKLNRKLSVQDSLPEDPEVYLQVVPWMIRSYQSGEAEGIKADDLRHAQDVISNWSPSSMKRKISAESTLANIHYALGNYDKAFESYETVIDMDPFDRKRYLQWIKRARAQGRFRVALRSARKARQVFQDDPQFDKLIETIGKESLRSLQQGE